MKKIIILFMMAFIVQTHGQTMKFHIDHYAINVLDLEKSVAFYQDIFSLEEIYDGTEQEHIRWFRLGDNQELHIIKVEKLESQPVKGVHIALKTINLDYFIKLLDQKEVPYFDWPGKKSKFSTRPDKVHQIYIQDPDGYWIEVNDGINRINKEK